MLSVSCGIMGDQESVNGIVHAQLFAPVVCCFVEMPALPLAPKWTGGGLFVDEIRPLPFPSPRPKV